MTERNDDGQMTALTRGGLCALGLLGVALVVVVVEADLHTEGILCGQKRCQANEYCNNHYNMCESCSDVCEKTSHNYQQDTCDKQCQDYLHEKRYMPRTSETEDLRSVVARLTVLVTVTLVVSVLALVALVVILVLFFWYRKQHNKQSPIFLKSNGIENGKVGYKTEPLKLDVTAVAPPPSTTTAPPPVTPATTSTPLSTRPRYPKEDPTLEYCAYDNPGLTPSPVFDNKPPENTPVNRRQESSF